MAMVLWIMPAMGLAVGVGLFLYLHGPGGRWTPEMPVGTAMALCDWLAGTAAGWALSGFFIRRGRGWRRRGPAARCRPWASASPLYAFALKDVRKAFLARRRAAGAP